MFKVFTKRNGEPFTHSVKALKVIWNKFPQWYAPRPPTSPICPSLFFAIQITLKSRNAHNTVHIDDLSRNFAMNPLSGIKITAFHNAATLSAGQDRELSLLQRYLHLLVERKIDFRRVEHHVSVLLCKASTWPDVLKAMETSLQASPERGEC